MRAKTVAILASALIGWSAPLHAGDAWTDATEALDRYDHARALTALRTAATAGHPRAQEIIAFMLWHGETLYPGVPANRAEALEWFGAAAQSGSPVALHLLRNWARNGSNEAARTLALIRP